MGGKKVTLAKKGFTTYSGYKFTLEITVTA